MNFFHFLSGILSVRKAAEVQQLRQENAQLEMRVETLNRELEFLKNMFCSYAASSTAGNGGNKQDAAESAAKEFDRLSSDPTSPGQNTRSGAAAAGRSNSASRRT